MIIPHLGPLTGTDGDAETVKLADDLISLNNPSVRGSDLSIITNQHHCDVKVCYS